MTRKMPIGPIRIFRGWWIVATAAVVGVTYTSVGAGVLSVFMVPLQEQFGWSRTAISSAVTVAAVGAMVITPIVGPLLDRFGSRYFLAAGGLALGGSLIALSFIQELWHFYLFLGLGRLTVMGVMSLAGQVAVSNWFLRQRGRAMALAMTGQRLGHAVLPVVAQALIVASGWRLTWAHSGSGRCRSDRTAEPAAHTPQARGRRASAGRRPIPVPRTGR